ncbi:DUF4856 domain-containing protein [Riemerella columbipharyngis]|uniref:DUF4856 domain-containing protein n=1 Tax=Riemerella columbipharyngis TaxID=1071918 RepID=A0A1G6YB55_9FLAO|nr:DUF4856 domain-containing protein [Riemerella columbipharyngis]SDD86806.1 protein of unknown function [Riemerella columbipharyngis]
MKTIKFFLPIMASVLTLSSCNNNDDTDVTVTPDKYTVPSEYVFTRNGKSSVDLSLGNQVYLKLKVLDDAAKDFKNINKADLLAIYTEKGADNFSLKELTAGNSVKYIEDNLNELVDIVAESKDVVATEGKAGNVGGKRMVNGLGFENAQLIQKGLMGALLLNQIFNNHLSDNVLKNKAVLDANNKATLMAGTNETELEMHWDTAYGILGLNQPNNVNAFWSGYLSKELTDIPETKGVKEVIETAFRTGRAAASAKDYKTMYEQVAIIREKLALVASIRAVHYLNSKIDVENVANSFHGLSEGTGFVYALQFTKKKDGSSYITNDECMSIINSIKGDKGLWDVDRLSKDENSQGSLKYSAKMIGDRFGFDYTKP